MLITSTYETLLVQRAKEVKQEQADHQAISQRELQRHQRQYEESQAPAKVTEGPLGTIINIFV